MKEPLVSAKTASKSVHKEDHGDSQKEKEVRANEGRLVENINKDCQSFLKIIHMQKEDPPSHKLEDHAAE